jgi:hypothetical protein
MLKHNEVNPLSVFGLRRVEHCPPHFTTFLFDSYVSEKVISDYIYEHLTGRFYLGDCFNEVDGTKTSQKMAAFELASEASYFSLVLNTINNQNVNTIF